MKNESSSVSLHSSSTAPSLVKTRHNSQCTPMISSFIGQKKICSSPRRKCSSLHKDCSMFNGIQIHSKSPLELELKSPEHSNNNITNLTKLKKVNENLNSVLSSMKKEMISFKDTFKKPESNKNLLSYLNISTNDNVTEAVTHQRTKSTMRMKITENILDGLDLDEPLGTSKDTEENNTGLHYILNNISVEEQIFLATFTNKRSEVDLHGILSEAIKKEKIIKELNEKIENLNSIVLNQKNQISEIQAANEKEKNELLEVVEKEKKDKEKQKEESKKNEESILKLEKENKYLKDRLAKMIYLKKASQSIISKNFQEFGEIQSKIQSEMNE